MESLFIKNTLLLSGQAMPFTGEWVNIARGRDTLYSFYANGTGSISLEYQSPFFAGQGIQFYQVGFTGTGPLTSSYSTSPMVDVRCVTYGSGVAWASVTSQN